VRDDEFAWPVRDPDHAGDESRYRTFGSSSSGRALLVAHSERGDRIRIISVRVLTVGERRPCEERRR
jgi:hypothetical protein